VGSKAAREGQEEKTYGELPFAEESDSPHLKRVKPDKREGGDRWALR
jgi:hypothetical protein